MCFLNLIKKNHGIRISSYFFRQLSPLIIAYITGRRTDHLGDTVFFHILRHIHANQILLGTEYHFRQSLGKFCLAHSCRSQEHKGSNRAFRVFQSHSASLDCLRNSMYCLILPDDTCMKHLLQLLQLLAFRLTQLFCRNPCPIGNDEGDVALRHMKLVLFLVLLPLFQYFIQFFLLLFLFLLDERRCFEIFLTDTIFLFSL